MGRRFVQWREFRRSLRRCQEFYWTVVRRHRWTGEQSEAPAAGTCADPPAARPPVGRGFYWLKHQPLPMKIRAPSKETRAMRVLRKMSVIALGLAAASAMAQVKVGIIAPFSGPFAHYGVLMKAGVEAYVASQGGKLAGQAV